MNCECEQSAQLALLCPAVEMGLRLALNELHAEAQDIAELFYEVHPGGNLVDVYLKVMDGRTAIGTAFVHAAGVQ